MVDIEHNGLCAFKQNALAGTAQAIEPFPDRFGVRQDLRGKREKLVKQSLLFEGRGAEAGQQRVVVAQQLIKFGGQGFGLREVTDTDGAAADFVFVSGADAAPGGADLVVAALFLAGFVQCRVDRQDQRRVVGDAQRFRGNGEALGTDFGDFGQQRVGVDDHAVANNAKLAAHQPTGEQRQFIGLVADDQGVAGIVPALEAHHDIGAAGEPIDDLALAFVAPLGADDGYVGHGGLLRKGRGGAVAG
ncbi:MAG: hypothetical protein H7268_00555 [Sandarakinorhabdus sp.]|nr:hypothetical protein [Sandarakinorhabdus sp.]